MTFDLHSGLMFFYVSENFYEFVNTFCKSLCSWPKVQYFRTINKQLQANIMVNFDTSGLTVKFNLGVLILQRIFIHYCYSAQNTIKHGHKCL